MVVVYCVRFTLLNYSEKNNEIENLTACEINHVHDVLGQTRYFVTEYAPSGLRIFLCLKLFWRWWPDVQQQ